jgi:hypothetical protein
MRMRRSWRREIDTVRSKRLGRLTLGSLSVWIRWLRERNSMRARTSDSPGHGRSPPFRRFQQITWKRQTGAFGHYEG